VLWRGKGGFSEMSETKITASAVKSLVGFYSGLPAATFFKGLTGYGFRIEDGIEGIGEISEDSQILHPSYIFITGGTSKGRKTLKAENIKSAVEFFQNNPLAAVLRVTTGRGFKMDSGMPQFCDVLECESQTIFELTHYGGRSISPMLQQEAGKVSDPNIKWQSGFEYKNIRSSEYLNLIRHLTEGDWEAQKGLDRVWADLQKEISRLTFFHCEDKLRKNLEKPDERSRIFLSQELNRYLNGSGQIQLPRGYNHEIRNDGVVIIKKSFVNVPGDETGFETAIKEFNKVCYQAYTLYCQPLGDSLKLGQPQDSVFGLTKTATIEFEKDSRRSTENKESLIVWSDRTPVFPQDGWTPEKKSYRVVLHRWGKGLRATPAPARYDDRFAQKDENTGSLQVVRVEFDGQEKVMEEEEFVFETKDDFSEGSWFATDLFAKDAAGTEFEITQTKTDYLHHMKQVARDSKLDWSRLSYDTQKYERTIPASEVWLKAPEYHHDQYSQVDLAGTFWQIRGKGIDPDGKETETCMQNPDAAHQAHAEKFKWEDIPVAVHQTHEQKYPICSCGQQRYEAKTSSQCYRCESYRNCARCSKETYFGESTIAKAEAEGVALLCSECKKWIEQIELANQFVQPAPQDHLAQAQERLEQALPEFRIKWDAMPGEGNPEGEVSGKDWVHEKKVKRFILADRGVEYRNVGNSKRRHEVYAEASKVVSGNWEAMKAAWISSSGIEWLKQEKPYNFEELLKAFRPEPSFRIDLKPFAVSDAHLNEFVDVEWRAWRDRREADFWAFLGDSQRHKAVVESAPEPEQIAEAQTDNAPSEYSVQDLLKRFNRV